MNNQVCEKLKAVLARYGRVAGEDARLFEAAMLDACRGEFRREVFVLTAAVRIGVPAQLLDYHREIPLESLLHRLSKKLQDETGIESRAAAQGIEAWASAVGVREREAPSRRITCTGCGAASIDGVPSGESLSSLNLYVCSSCIAISSQKTTTAGQKQGVAQAHPKTLPSVATENPWLSAEIPKLTAVGKFDSKMPRVDLGEVLNCCSVRISNIAKQDSSLQNFEWIHLSNFNMIVNLRRLFAVSSRSYKWKGQNRFELNMINDSIEVYYSDFMFR